MMEVSSQGVIQQFLLPSLTNNGFFVLHNYPAEGRIQNLQLRDLFFIKMFTKSPYTCYLLSYSFFRVFGTKLKSLKTFMFCDIEPHNIHSSLLFSRFRLWLASTGFVNETKKLVRFRTEISVILYLFVRSVDNIIKQSSILPRSPSNSHSLCDNFLYWNCCF